MKNYIWDDEEDENELEENFEYALAEMDIDEDEFNEMDNYEKVFILEEAGLYAGDYEHLFEDYYGFCDEDDEIKILRRNGINVDEFYFANDTEKLEMLEKVELEPSTFRDYFDDYTCYEGRYNVFSFDEYDYYNANSYFQRDDDCIDLCEGNEIDETVVCDEKNNRKIARNYNQLYFYVKMYFPEMSSTVDAIAAIPPAKSNEVKSLIRMAQNGDTKSFNRIVEIYMKDILKISYNESIRYNEDFYDVFYRNKESLLEGIHKFNPDIYESIMQYVHMKKKYTHIGKRMKKDKYQHLPVTMRIMFNKWDEFWGDKDEIIARCKRGLNKYEDPTFYFTYDEIKYIWGEECTEARLKKFLFYNDIEICSLESLLEDGKDNFDPRIGECFVGVHDIGRQVECEALQDLLIKVFSTLRYRERDIIISRYGLEDGYIRTLEEVAKKHGVTRERIRQIESKALRTLRGHGCRKHIKSYLDNNEFVEPRNPKKYRKCL